MKQIFLVVLSGYQKIISPLLHQLLGQRTLCRYEVSCSEFAKQAIQQKGVIKGVRLTALRFLSCNPLTKSYEYL